MSKKGKIAGILALVLAIAALVFAILEWNQSKKYAAHYAELADAVCGISEKLDSQSGVAEQISFRVEGGKESGSLSMSATQGVPGATKEAVQPLIDLADKVVEQREAIVETVIEKVVVPLQCPEEKRPTAETLNNVNGYSGSLDGFVAFVNARVKRDNATREQINKILGSLGVRDRYSAFITETGALSDADRRAFTAGETNLGCLKANYSQLAAAVKEFAGALSASSVKDSEGIPIQWDSPAAVRDLSRDGLDGKDKTGAVIRQLKADLGKLKTQLARIDKLENEKKELEGALAAAHEEIQECQKHFQKDEDILKSLLDQFTPHSTYDVKQITSIEEVDMGITGQVIDINAKYGYVIINLTQANVIEGLRLCVFSHGKYLGQLRVLHPMPSNSLAIIEKGDVSDIQVGDSILVADKILQDESLYNF